MAQGDVSLYSRKKNPYIVSQTISASNKCTENRWNLDDLKGCYAQGYWQPQGYFASERLTGNHIKTPTFSSAISQQCIQLWQNSKKR